VIGLGDAATPADLVGMTPGAVRGVRLLDGTLADLVLDSGLVTAVAPAGSVAAVDALDADGWRLIPAPCEPHAHLDKALTAERIRPGAGLDLRGAVESWKELAPSIDADDVRARSLAAIRRYLERGFTAIRTHVNLGEGQTALQSVEVLVALRDELADVLTLQVCLLPGHLTPDSVLREAIALGVDAFGGCPHLAPDPHHETTRLLDLAEAAGLPVDLHTDEQTEAGTVDLQDLAEQVIARGMQQQVTASHCVRLGSLPPERLEPVLDVVARAGIGVVGLPITNLYLQGWDTDHLMPRGITAARALLDAGILFGAGADNLRDPFNPVGRADPFETTSLLVAGAHLRIEEALAAVTTGARAVVGLPRADGTAGSEASFLLVPDDDLGDVVAGAQDARVVVHRGRVVAESRVVRASALDPTRATPSDWIALTPTIGG
jgi:cytosine/creatinine deaminase